MTEDFQISSQFALVQIFQVAIVLVTQHRVHILKSLQEQSNALDQTYEYF